MSLSFVVHGPSTGRAKRPPFKAKLNVGLHRSHIGEIALSYRTCRCSTAALDGLEHSCKFELCKKACQLVLLKLS